MAIMIVNNVSAKNIGMPQGFKDLVDEKSERIEKVAPDNSEMRIVLIKNKDNARGKDATYKIKGRLIGDGVDVNVEQRGRTPEAALNLMIDRLARAVRHAKERSVQASQTGIASDYVE